MLRGALQWALAVALGLPIMIAAIFVWLPLSVPLWAVVWCRTRKIAPRAQSAAGAKPHPLEVRPKGWVFCYVTCLALTWHAFIRLWAKVARPQVVFVVYHNTIHTLGAFFCLHTGKVLTACGVIDEAVTPEEPWFLGLGLISCGPRTGLGLVVGLDPVLDNITKEQLTLLPRNAQRAFPWAKAIALAGRLPGLVQGAAGAALQPPLVDGLAGTVFAMEETVHALRARLPEEKQANATVAILGGGGYIGSRLVNALAGGSIVAPAPAPQGAAVERSDASDGTNAHVEIVIPSDPSYRQVIALDLRYKERTQKDRVLYTSNPADLSLADIVLVITASGEDAAQYVEHARAGQEWGDDTHPEMGHKVLRAMAAKGVNVSKAMAARAAMTRFFPPLPGWPVGGTPGCLLMALVTNETGRSWNGCGAAEAGSSKAAAGGAAGAAGAAGGAPPYSEFKAAAKSLGFGAMLVPHKPYLA